MSKRPCLIYWFDGYIYYEWKWLDGSGCCCSFCSFFCSFCSFCLTAVSSAHHPLESTVTLLSVSSLPILRLPPQFAFLILPAKRAQAIQTNIQQAVVENGFTVASRQFLQKYSLWLTAWFRAAKQVALGAASSALVERVFAMYWNLFGKQQDSACADRRAGSVMVIYSCTIGVDEELVEGK